MTNKIDNIDINNIVFRGTGKNAATMYIDNGFIISEGRKGEDCFKIPVRNITDIKYLGRKRISMKILGFVLIYYMVMIFGCGISIIESNIKSMSASFATGAFYAIVLLVFGTVLEYVLFILTKMCFKNGFEYIVCVMCASQPYEIKFKSDQKENADKAYDLINEEYESYQSYMNVERRR